MPRQVMYSGRRIQVALDTETAPDGHLIQRDIVLHPGAVAILPLVDDTHVCLLKNRRPNVGETLIEIPAGCLEPGEEPAAAAIRELAEETGYRAARWRKLTDFFPSPGCLSERTHLFVAQDLMAGDMRPERDEDLQPFVTTWQEALTWALDGTLRDAKTVLALLLWDRLRE
ncbi:MAG: NUDIX hydrolase [Planctomycetia bacterium]|nr:NUDIX hydrolase [Planctomycetia bacterium]